MFRRILPGLLICGLWATSVLAQEAAPAPELSKPGNHTRRIQVDGKERTYLVHVPKSYTSATSTPLVIALHGAAMDGKMMASFSGLDKKSDEAGFIVVYPSGTGVGSFRVWNAGGFSRRLARDGVDDVAFIGKMLDELSGVFNLDSKRIYACGMSNGGMMCYRLAAQMSDRIAAIAPVAGTIAIAESKPTRPVSVMHFHGSDDKIVPVAGTSGKTAPYVRLKSVQESVQTWVKLNECQTQPQTDTISKEGDEMKVTRQTYGAGRDNAEVVLIVIDDAGHTWPGQPPPVGFIGKSVLNISANDLLWDFFQKHPRK